MAEHLKDQAQEDANNKAGPLETGRKLARLVIQRIVVPLIVAGLLDLDEVIELIKRGVVSALSGMGESNQRIAAHLSRSRRWFQDYLKKIREEKQAGFIGGSEHPISDPDEATPGAAYKFMLDVLLALSTVYPGAVDLSTLRDLMDVPNWDLDDTQLIHRLELYEKIGVLKIIGNDGKGPLVQASERVPSFPTRPGQLERLGERLSWVVPLALTYCSGKGDFGGIVAELSPQALDRARSRLRDAVADIVADAVAETHKSQEPIESDVKVRVIIAIGAAGGFDEKQ